jgi:ADP-ribose pyrophosphatase YjhB (NUDIX family)
MKRAVCAIIPTDNFLFLSTTRRNSAAIGFPGGKVDDGEENLQALVREVFEETGMQFAEKDFTLIYEAEESGFLVSTYAYNGAINHNAHPHRWSIEDGINCEFSPEWEFTTADSGAFHEYNNAAFGRFYAWKRGNAVSVKQEPEFICPQCGSMAEFYYGGALESYGYEWQSLSIYCKDDTNDHCDFELSVNADFSMIDHASAERALREAWGKIVTKSKKG